MHYRILAWEIPWTEDPGGLQLVGVSRVGHNLATKPPPPPIDIQWVFFFFSIYSLHPIAPCHQHT